MEQPTSVERRDKLSKTDVHTRSSKKSTDGDVDAVPE
jgi:hypothetical protein